VHGARWVSGRRERSALAAAVFPPEADRWMVIPDDLQSVPAQAGVFRLFDGQGQVLRITGVADLRQGLVRALDEPGCAAASHFQVELDPLYTQRESELLARYVQEHGRLPLGNGVDDDLFDDEA
jgi:hypothetical protein